MSIYQCDTCGCLDNTALTWWCLKCKPDLWHRSELNGKALCSACTPKVFKNGDPTGLGKWHGQFERRFFLIGSLYTGPNGGVLKKSDNTVPKKEDEVDAPA